MAWRIIFLIIFHLTKITFFPRQKSIGNYPLVLRFFSYFVKVMPCGCRENPKAYRAYLTNKNYLMSQKDDSPKKCSGPGMTFSRKKWIISWVLLFLTGKRVLSQEYFFFITPWGNFCSNGFLRNNFQNLSICIHVKYSLVP